MPGVSGDTRLQWMRLFPVYKLPNRVIERAEYSDTSLSSRAGRLLLAGAFGRPAGMHFEFGSLSEDFSDLAYLQSLSG